MKEQLAEQKQLLTDAEYKRFRTMDEALRSSLCLSSLPPLAVVPTLAVTTGWLSLTQLWAAAEGCQGAARCSPGRAVGPC